MKKLMLIPIVCILVAMSACPEYVDKLAAERFEQKVAQFKADNGRDPTPAEETLLAQQSHDEVVRELKKDEGKVVEGAGQVVTGVSTGNIMLIVMGALTLLGGGTAVYKKYKRAKERKT